ncbi:4-phosphoerythronate dehydrogenase [Kaarinaea lacus]
MAPLNIVADANIPFVEQAFETLGTVTTVEGRSINPSEIKDADILLVRSVTPVNQELLAGSRVRFVATATIGTDHVDETYLRENQIGFASAPGCNAISAAEYVVSGLINVAQQSDIDLSTKTVAVVGCGNVGSQLIRLLTALNIQYVAYDPPRAQHFQDRDYSSWEDVLQADIISAHVPLTFDGDYPTYRMFDEAFFNALKEQAIFVNTARGRVVDESALLGVLDKRDDLNLILDVWEHEPNINEQLLQKTRLATPHIAGYSLDGKVRGTEMIYQAVCEFVNQAPQWQKPVLPYAESFTAIQIESKLPDQQAISKAVFNAYDIHNDDARLRQVLDQPKEQRGAYFDQLRKNYPVRREFSCYELVTSEDRVSLNQCLKQMGFKVEAADPSLAL